ncbi:YfhO family protein [Nonlabens mediterrranea]|uniref:YfhO family protein n=1 Tax=Nonlabens mediterrranea TaxID=1419947 RepID=A0ABS0A7N9_9FLAO|nr:YfhO family protein [Nonlabens mediterrranea]
MTFNFKKLLPHLAVLAVFIIAALAYFNPVLSGKKLYQNDIVQYKGNARQLIEHRAATGEELYWTDSVFGGMPTYQLGARYPYDFIDGLDRALRFLPRPADYLFLYFFSFYMLMLVMRVNWKIGLLGALAFGFSTYLIIILGVGHNAKAHAIAYFPLVLSGIILVFQKRYLLGFVVTALAMALELQANHPQMTYYLLLAVIILGVAYLIDAIRKNVLPHYFKSIGIMVAAVLLALGTNAGNLLATSEYSKESTRGKSDLSINAQGEEIVPKTGLDYDYITQYSYGLSESLNLLVPRFAGGGSGARPDEDSNAVKYLTDQGLPKGDVVRFINDNVPLYWGDQIIVEAPPYLGIGVVFLAVLGLFMIKGRLRWWTSAVIIIALLLSYGKNADWITSFFIDVVPLYNKFRAVTSIQVLIELCVPILAVVGLWQFFNDKNTEEAKAKALKYAGITIGGLLLILIALGGQLFDFASSMDQYYMESDQLGIGFVDALRDDRFEIMRADALRSLLIVGVIAVTLFLLLKKKLTENIVLIIAGVVILFDLVSFDMNYVNSDDYVTASEYDNAHRMTPADEIAMKDAQSGDHYRVYDLLLNPFNSGRAPYFHKSIGGYHGAKPRRIQELSEFYLFDENGIAPITRENIEILSMFNVRYIIDTEETGYVAKENPMAMGNAWFVDSLKIVANDNEEITSLTELNGNQLAVIQQDQKDMLKLTSTYADSTASIQLVDYDTQHLVYRSSNAQESLAVFSEMYYPHGWKATIDGSETPIARVNYTLRGIKVPAGSHEIVMSFEPQVVTTGSNIMLGSNILLILVMLGGLFYTFKKKS